MAQLTNEQYLEKIQTGLISELTKHKEALPPGFNRERFILNCITVIQDMMKDRKKREKLTEVKIETIPVCLAQGAYLGLDFFNGECYAVPYDGVMQFQTDYKGEIKICKKHSKAPIRNIFAKVVREGDFFEEEVVGGEQKICHKPVPFSTADMVGAFAVVLYKDGTISYDTMSKAEIEKTREVYSKAPNSPAWKNSPGEMYKKTVLRRLCKLIDLDFDNIEQRIAYENGGDAIFDEQNRIAGTAQAALPDKGEPIDVFAQTRQAEKEPVPVGKNQSDNEDEFRRFEQQQYGQQQYEQPPVGDDFIIPDDIPDENLPWR